MDINHAITLEYHDFLSGVGEFFVEEYEKSMIYNSVGNTLASFFAFSRHLFESNETCSNFFGDILVPIGEVYQYGLTQFSAQKAQMPLRTAVVPWRRIHAPTDIYEYTRSILPELAYAIHKFLQSDQNELSQSAAAAFLSATGKLKHLINILPKLLKFSAEELRDTPAVQKMMKALKEYRVNFELIAPVVFDLVTELEGAGICGTTCYQNRGSLCSDCPKLRKLREVYPTVKAHAKSLHSSLLLILMLSFMCLFK